MSLDKSGLLRGEAKFCDEVLRQMTPLAGETDALVLAAVVACALAGEPVTWPGYLYRWRENVLGIAEQFKLRQVTESGLG